MGTARSKENERSTGRHEGYRSTGESGNNTNRDKREEFRGDERTGERAGRVKMKESHIYKYKVEQSGKNRKTNKSL